MAEAVVIGDLELEFVTGLTVDEGRKVVVHRWPGTDGDLVQDMGMAAARLWLAGVAIGEKAGNTLEQLRGVMRAGKPVDFAASATIAAQIDQVVVGGLRVVQPPGRPDYYEYQLELVHYTPPPPPARSGFNIGSLDAINAAVDTSALSALQDAAGQLGSVEGVLAGIDDAMQAAMDAAEMVVGAAEGLIGGLMGLKPIISAGGDVIQAAAK